MKLNNKIQIWILSTALFVSDATISQEVEEVQSKVKVLVIWWNITKKHYLYDMDQDVLNALAKTWIDIWCKKIEETELKWEYKAKKIWWIAVEQSTLSHTQSVVNEYYLRVIEENIDLSDTPRSIKSPLYVQWVLNSDNCDGTKSDNQDTEEKKQIPVPETKKYKRKKPYVYDPNNIEV